MWKTLKTLVNLKTKFINNNVTFTLNNRTVLTNTEQDKAENINRYFISSITDIRSSIPIEKDWLPYQLPIINSSFQNFRLLTLNDLKVIKN